jgi:hypothetical protein
MFIVETIESGRRQVKRSVLNLLLKGGNRRAVRSLASTAPDARLIHRAAGTHKGADLRVKWPQLSSAGPATACALRPENIVKRKRRKPLQYGLASLFWLMTAVAVAIWLDVPYWLHLGSVAMQILVVLAGLSLVGAAIIAPFAIFALLKWLVEESNWEMLVDKAREFSFRRPRKPRPPPRDLP